MSFWRHLTRPPWRTLGLLIGILGVLGLGFLLWSPGKTVWDGRHDLGSNGLWLQHGWLGDDSWFERNQRDKTRFRDPEKVQVLSHRLNTHGIQYVFPHACPTDSSGRISPVDPVQTELFLDHIGEVKVLPWIGGVLQVHCFPSSPEWRATFISSAVDLLVAHPRLAGLHLNIEPLPTGTPDFLLLLDELRKALPEGALLSVAAYPPPTRWHPFPEVHWEEQYFRQVAKRVDQLVPMMYDTSLKWPKVYQQLLASWTSDVLEWSGDTQVLLGIPAYEDEGVGYHVPEVENLENALKGIHAGLSRYASLPQHYAGIAMYSEWVMDEEEWGLLREEFLAR